MAILTGNECPSGYYCPSKTDFDVAGEYYDKIPCPPGTYFAGTGATSVNDCTACDDGKYCEDAGQSAVTGDCEPGYFCRTGSTSSKPYSIVSDEYGPCPAGYYCPDGTHANMVACPAGSMQPINNANYGTYGLTDNSLADANGVCLSCPPGYYCASTGMTAVTDLCSVGFYCELGSDQAEPPTTFCSATEYCPQGSYKANDCPIGFY